MGLQRTIGGCVTLSGVGVHTGQAATIIFSPAEQNTGIVFKRRSSSGIISSIRAVASEISSTELCTVLGRPESVSVSTVEHLMAALYAVGVDNMIVDVDSAEIPIMDGSASVFIDAIDQVGIEVQAAKRQFIRVLHPVRTELGGSWAEFLPYDGTRFEVTIDFDNPAIGKQQFAHDVTTELFRKDLANARTFGFMRDVQELWSSGHALGSSLENSVVIGDGNHIINPEGLRFKDEFVRHKTLDAIGDLALAGAQFVGCYRSYRGGHKLNAKALKALLSNRSVYEIVESPSNNPTHDFIDMVVVNTPAFSPWVH